MAKKKSEKREARVKADEGTSAELNDVETAPEVEKAAPKAETKAKTAKDKYIQVRATRGLMHDPFQKIYIREEGQTPVLKTQWIECQMAAGLIEEC